MLKRKPESRGSLEEIVRRFNNPKRQRSGYLVQCPAHDDNKNSLSIHEGEQGIVLKCFAGCATASILERRGLTFADLFNKPKANSNKYYVYTDEAGNPLYRVCRTPDKNFRQEKYVGNGNYISEPGCMQGVRRVPYNLPGIIKSNAIFSVEGEKNADDLIARNIPATTHVGGASKWRAEYNQYFKHDIAVYLLSDNDEAGLNDVCIRAENLVPVAAEVYRVDLPDMPPKGDVSDYFLARHSRDEFLDHAEKVAKLITPDNIKTEFRPSIRKLDGRTELTFKLGQSLCRLNLMASLTLSKGSYPMKVY